MRNLPSTRATLISIAPLDRFDYVSISISLFHEEIKGVPMLLSNLKKHTLFLFLTIVLPVFVSTLADSAPPAIHVQFRRSFKPDVDLFLSSWKESSPRKIYGSFQVWDILTDLEGTPLRPRKKGAVLTDLKAVRYAILKPAGSTRPMELSESQYILYITAGQGKISTKKREAELFEGIGVIVPPDIEFTLMNTGNLPLSMYIIEEPIPDDFDPRDEIVVRYEYDNKISTNVNRVDSSEWLFSVEDDLSTLVSFNPVMYEPKSLVPRHVHEPGIEEVWISIKGDMQLMVGDQVRKFSPGSAYKVPADGITPHTNINKSDTSKKLLWMMKVPLVRVPPSERPKNRNGVI